VSVARIKGANVVEVVKSLRQRGEAARARLPNELHHFLEERILVSSWYSEFDALELMRALVSLQGGNASTWELMGRLAAHTQARATYKHFVTAREPARIVQHAHVMWQTHHDSGELKVEFEADTTALLSLHDYPALCVEWCHLMIGFCSGLVEAAGAQKPVCRLASSDLKAKKASFKLSWTPPRDETTS
jgi:uncharacterized protein (TIGR02265 family)